MDPLDRLQGAAPAPVGVLLRLQIRFKDRFEHQQGRSLHNPIFDRRNSQRPLRPVRFGRDHRRVSLV